MGRTTLSSKSNQLQGRKRGVREGRAGDWMGREWEEGMEEGKGGGSGSYLWTVEEGVVVLGSLPSTTPSLHKALPV